MTFEAARCRFPGVEQSIYLNVASCGLLSNDVCEALNSHVAELRDGKVNKAEYFATVERVREKFARLINADADEIAFTKNVSDGINMIAAAIDWEAGENVVICAELEHPNNIVPWFNIRDRFGVEIRTVAPEDGEIDVIAIAKTIDSKTRLVTASTVTFSPGKRTDMEALGSICRERNIFLMADGAQSVGVMTTDVQELQIDGLAVATQKALLGLYGMGFLYCRREIAESLRPAALARFSVDFGEDMHEASTGTEDAVRLMRGARRFDIGNYNYAATHAIERSLDLLLEIGPREIERYVLQLAIDFARRLKELGVPVYSSMSEAASSHIVTAGKYDPAANDIATDPATNSLAMFLKGRGVVCSVRRGLIRFALHLYNDKSDVDAVLRLVRQWKSKHEELQWTD